MYPKRESCVYIYHLSYCFTSRWNKYFSPKLIIVTLYNFQAMIFRIKSIIPFLVLKQIFDSFDLDKKGEISVDMIGQILDMLGHRLTAEELQVSNTGIS